MDICISETFAVENKIIFHTTQKRKIKTAEQSSAGLCVVGENKVTIYIGESPYLVRMWVVRGLSHSANIGNTFLHRNKIKIAPGNSVFLRDGQRVPLIATMRASASAEPASNRIGCKQKASATTAEPTSEMNGCKLKASEMTTEPTSDMTGCDPKASVMTT